MQIFWSGYEGYPQNSRRISETEFNIVAGHLTSTLKKFKVPKQETKELMGIIGSLKKDIVE